MRATPIILCIVLLVAGSCSDTNDSKKSSLKTGWYHVVGSGQGVARKLGDTSTYYLDPEPIVPASHFKTITVESFPHADTLWQVVVQLDSDGRAKFARATETLIGQDLVFVLNDSLWAEPIRIQAKIPSGIIVINKRGKFSQQDAEMLKDRLETELKTQQ